MPALLVVDDERSILLAFRRAFRHAGLDVLTAETGAEGAKTATILTSPVTLRRSPTRSRVYPRSALLGAQVG